MSLNPYQDLAEQSVDHFEKVLRAIMERHKAGRPVSVQRAGRLFTKMERRVQRRTLKALRFALYNDPRGGAQ